MIARITPGYPRIVPWHLLQVILQGTPDVARAPNGPAAASLALPLRKFKGPLSTCNLGPCDFWDSPQKNLRNKNACDFLDVAPPPTRKNNCQLVNWQTPSTASLWGSGQRGLQGRWQGSKAFFRRKTRCAIVKMIYIHWSTVFFPIKDRRRGWSPLERGLLYPNDPQCTVTCDYYVRVGAWLKPKQCYFNVRKRWLASWCQTTPCNIKSEHVVLPTARSGNPAASFQHFNLRPKGWWTANKIVFFFVGNDMACSDAFTPDTKIW